MLNLTRPKHFQTGSLRLLELRQLLLEVGGDAAEIHFLSC